MVKRAPNNLVMYRKKEQITQKELADLLGVTKDYISRIETGKVNPSFNLAKKIADLFCTTVDNIFFISKSNENFYQTS